jgi:ELWxxDGT repeat protein
VVDLLPGSPSGVPGALLAGGGALLFSANDGVAGTELWRSDGTAPGTVLLHDIAPGAASSSPQGPFVVSGARVYFGARDDATGHEPWSLPFSGLVDSDGDGLDDATEASLGTNPNDADSDDDGLADGAEVLAIGTDPLLADSDGDGHSDGAEVGAGSNPLDPGSVPGAPQVPALPGAASVLLAAALLLALQVALRLRVRA